MNGNLVVSMVTQERKGSPEAVLIYFCIHNISPLKSIANQSLSITAIFVSSRHGKERCVTRQNGASGTNSLRAQPIIVSSRKVPPHKEAKKALRYKTKSCGIKMHE